MALTEYVIMPGEDYQAICDAVRAKTGKTEALKSGDLSAEVAQIEVDDGSKDQLRKLVDGTIESYVFPEDINIVKAGLFWNCKKLIINELPNSITTIGNSSFYNCNSLNLLRLPDNLIKIETSAFMLAKVHLTDLPNNLEVVQSYAFNGTGSGLLFTEIPASVKELGASCFYNGNFQTLTFKGTPKSIHSSSFSQCLKLTTINVPWPEGEVAGAPWGAVNATINYNYVEPILWEVGFSCFGTSENKIIKNGNHPNRITAHQAHGQFDLKVTGQSVYKDNYPITVPSNATTLSISVPEEYVHGVIFWKCNGLEDTVVIKDYGWNGSQFVYDLANYPGTTHITINVKKPDNSNIDYTGDFSDFSVVFGT